MAVTPATPGKGPVPAQRVTLRLTFRELASVRAALRFHADENLQTGPPIPDAPVERIASIGGTIKPLNYQEAEYLLERLNLAESEPDPLRQIHDLLYLDTREGREDADTLARIAEVLGRYIPQPRRRG